MYMIRRCAFVLIVLQQLFSSYCLHIIQKILVWISHQYSKINKFNFLYIYIHMISIFFFPIDCWCLIIGCSNQLLMRHSLIYHETCYGKLIRMANLLSWLVDRERSRFYIPANMSSLNIYLLLLYIVPLISIFTRSYLYFRFVNKVHS